MLIGAQPRSSPRAALVRGPDGSVHAFATRLLLPPLRPEVAETGWVLARSPASLRAEAVGVLFQAVAGIAMVAFAVGALGVVAARTWPGRSPRARRFRH